MGWRLRPSRGLRTGRNGEVLLGGSPPRLMTLSERGARTVRAWLAGQPAGEDHAERLLARRLLDAGLAEPDPPPRPQRTGGEATIVVPVHGNGRQLERCLAALSGGVPTIVVDDGSPDGAAIAALADRFGARYVRHGENRGAAAARNTGLRLAETPIVAFLDSDCIPPQGFPGDLLDHLEDPAVALVAPRIVSSGRRAGRIAAYERCHSPLDMGPRPSLVRPYTWVWYVPSAAMVARREALGSGFDEQLSLGEDVDLVWRLHDAGWQVRYEPRIHVAHEERVQPAAWYRRRVAYNESVSPLVARHPERVPALFVTPMPALGWAAALSGRWPALVALTALRGVRLHRTVAGRLPGAPIVGGSRRRAGDHPRGARARTCARGPMGAVRAARRVRGTAPRRGRTTRRAARRWARGRLDRGPSGTRPGELRRPARRRRIRSRRRHVARVPTRA